MRKHIDIIKSKNKELDITYDLDLGNLQSSIVIISGMSEDFCRIVNLNNSAASLFGYQKNELLSKIYNKKFRQKSRYINAGGL